MKLIETSGNKTSGFNQSILLGLILVAIPFVKIIDSVMANSGIETRTVALVISTMIGVFSGYIVTNKIYEQIKLVPMFMNKNQFEEFYIENKRRLKVVKWIMICFILSLFIEIYIYIRLGIFLAVFIFLLNILVVTLLFLGGVHSREQIFGEIEKLYMNN